MTTTAPALPTATFVKHRDEYDIWSVPSTSNPAEPHAVVAYPDGTIHCPCPHHTLGGATCKHIKAVIAATWERCNHE